MRKYFLSAIIFMSVAQQAFCASEVVNAVASPALETSLKSNANEPNIFSIIFALIFVIFLIYITGLIYSRLNIVGAKAIKEQLKNYDLNTVMVLSTKQLGQGKNLHVIEIDNKRYLIGAAQNSITMLKELEPISHDAQDDEEFLIEEEPVDQFDIHKKYL